MFHANVRPARMVLVAAPRRRGELITVCVRSSLKNAVSSIALSSAMIVRFQVRQVWPTWEKLGAFLLRGGQPDSERITLFTVEGGESAVNEVDAGSLLGAGRSIVGVDNLGGEGLDFWGVGGAQIGERGVRDFRRSRVLLLGGNFRQGEGAEGAEQE